MIGHLLDGARIRQLRRDRCLTQAELGAKLGVTQTTISEIERGQVGRPQCLAELMAFFGVRVWDLLVLPDRADPAQPGPVGQAGTGAGGGTGPGPEGEAMPGVEGGTEPGVEGGTEPGAEAGRAGGPSAQDPPYWTVPEAAAVLGVSRKIVYRLVRSGALEMQKAGRSWRIPSASVRAHLAPQARPVCDPVPACQQRPELTRIDGRRLRALRQAREWTQLELARRAGLSLSSVSALETGHYTKTSALTHLAWALGVTAGELQEPAVRPPHPVPGGEGPGVPVPPAWRADGARLRQVREARGLTQADLARRAGLSRSFLSTLERGHRIRPAHIPALTRALGVPPADLAAPELAAEGSGCSPLPGADLRLPGPGLGGARAPGAGVPGPVRRRCRPDWRAGCSD